jgi:hypothetical protein
MNKTALLISGLGLSAGLIYILDPERRRAMARAQLKRYRRQTDDLWDHTTRSLGRQAREFLAMAPLARRYRRPRPAELLLARVEQLVVLGRNNPAPYTVNGRPLYVHLNGLAIVLLK